MGFLGVCREPRGASCVPACKGARKSVFLNQTASKITPDPSASQNWSDPDTLHPKGLGEAPHTHLFCIDLHQEEQLSLGCATAELPFSDNSLTPFLAAHQLSSLPLYFWADSLPGYAMASTTPLAFSREDVCGLQCEHRLFLLEGRSPGVKRDLGISKATTAHLGTDSWPQPSTDPSKRREEGFPRENTKVR